MSLKSIIQSKTGASVIQSLKSTLVEVGRSAIHATLPDDFEYYLCSLELVNHLDERVGFLSFTVMPEQINESYAPIQTMIKTHSGVVTVYNDSFAPVDINISGTFGRKIRLLLNYKDPYIETGGRKFATLNFGKLTGVETGVKSGYGMTKILQHILENSAKSDEFGRPHYLKFYNYALNTAYICDVVNFSLNQNVGSNMMWNYNISLRATAKLSNVSSVKNRLKQVLPQVASNSIANGVTKIANGMIGL